MDAKDALELLAKDEIDHRVSGHAERASEIALALDAIVAEMELLKDWTREMREQRNSWATRCEEAAMLFRECVTEHDGSFDDCYKCQVYKKAQGLLTVKSRQQVYDYKTEEWQAIGPDDEGTK